MLHQIWVESKLYSSSTLTFLFQADVCPPGYYCPEGTGYRFSNPCPVGFYRKLSAAVSVQDCSVCFSGHFCDVLGLADPKVCPEVSHNLNPLTPGSNLSFSLLSTIYSSYNVSSENLVLDQLIIPKLIYFFILTTCLLDILLIL